MSRSRSTNTTGLICALLLAGVLRPLAVQAQDAAGSSPYANSPMPRCGPQMSGQVYCKFGTIYECQLIGPASMERTTGWQWKADILRACDEPVPATINQPNSPPPESPYAPGPNASSAQGGPRYPSGQSGQGNHRGQWSRGNQAGPPGQPGQYGQPGQGGQYHQGSPNGPGNQYGQGSPNGPGGQYGQGSPNGQGGQYGQGSPNGQGGQYGQGSPNGQGGQYGQGSPNGQGGQYGQASAGASPVPDSRPPGGTMLVRPGAAAMPGHAGVQN